MRSAWNVRVAGWIRSGRACTTRPTMSASARVVRIGAFGAGADDGARDRAGMPLLAERSDDGGEVALGGLRHHVGGARPVAAHAHVERAVEAERKAALGLVELHRRDAEIEHDAVDRVVAKLPRDRCEGWRSGPRTSMSRPPAASTRSAPARDRALVAIDADDAAIGRRQNRARIAAGAERARRYRRRRRAPRETRLRGRPSTGM